MRKLKVKDLEVGMVLAEDIHDKNGRFLLGGSCELMEKHIRALKAWGVFSVNVEGGPDEADDHARGRDPARVAEAEAATRRRFVLADLDHPLVRELFQEAVRLELEREAGNSA